MSVVEAPEEVIHVFVGQLPGAMKHRDLLDLIRAPADVLGQLGARLLLGREEINLVVAFHYYAPTIAGHVVDRLSNLRRAIAFPTPLDDPWVYGLLGHHITRGSGPRAFSATHFVPDRPKGSNANAVNFSKVIRTRPPPVLNCIKLGKPRQR
jgi:hypothetical protein